MPTGNTVFLLSYKAASRTEYQTKNDLSLSKYSKRGEINLKDRKGMTAVVNLRTFSLSFCWRKSFGNYKVNFTMFLLLSYHIVFLSFSNLKKSIKLL
jgi:hypothetical protein